LSHQANIPLELFGAGQFFGGPSPHPNSTELIILQLEFAIRSLELCDLFSLCG